MSNLSIWLCHNNFEHSFLCVDRIYNTNLEPEDCAPACVKACPTGVRHFGDLGDPESDVSQLVKARDGFELLPDMNYKPVNKYLPPRKRWYAVTSAAIALPKGDGSAMDRLFSRADKFLSGKPAGTIASLQDMSDKLEG